MITWGQIHKYFNFRKTIKYSSIHLKELIGQYIIFSVCMLPSLNLKVGRIVKSSWDELQINTGHDCYVPSQIIEFCLSDEDKINELIKD